MSGRPYLMTAYDSHGRIVALHYATSNVAAATYGSFALTSGAARYVVEYVGS